MPTRFPFAPGRASLSLNTKAMKPTGPTINRGKGNNNAATPWPFIRAVEKKFGLLGGDLACTSLNMKAPRGLDECINSLTVDWADWLKGELGWDNPPFTNITPWARYHAEQVQRGAKTLLLVPASVGANWYWDWVVPYADVYSVGRMVFDDCYDKHGKLITDPYPKDLVLAHYEWRGETLRTGSKAHFPSPDNTGLIYRWRWQDA